MNPLDQRPLIIAVAGPNGAGKSTFFEAHLRDAGLRFVNADELARELKIDAYRAAELADKVRRGLVATRESFVFETVFSDPQQEKVRFLRDAADSGYTVMLCFIGLKSADLSDERVTLRTLEGGHDIPREKLLERYPRSLHNLAHAMRELPSVRIYDNSISNVPHRHVATLGRGRVAELDLPAPTWVVAHLLNHLPRELKVERVERAADLTLLDLSADYGLVRVRSRGAKRVPKVGETVTFGPDLRLTRASERTREQTP